MIFGQNQRADPITPGELTDVIANRPTPAGEYFGSVVKQNFEWTTIGQVIQAPPEDYHRVDPSFPIGRAPPRYIPDQPIMTHDEWVNSPWGRKDIPFDNKMTVARARAKAEVYDNDQVMNWLRQNRAMGVGTVAMAITGSLLGSAPDPTNYIPVFGPAFKVAAAGRVANILLRSGVAAVDASLMTAATEPMIASSRRQFGDDISFANQMLDIAVGGVLGGVLGGVHGWRERLSSYHPEVVSHALQTLGEAADAIANDRPLDLGAAFRQMDSTRGKLMGGTALGRSEPMAFVPRSEAIPTDSVDLPGSALNPPKLHGTLETPVYRPDGSPAVYPADLTGFKSEIKRMTEAAAKEGRTLELQKHGDQNILIEKRFVDQVDRFPDERSAQTALNRMPPKDRVGLTIIPTRDGFSIYRGLSGFQASEIRKNPELADQFSVAPESRAADQGAVSAPSPEIKDQTAIPGVGPRERLGERIASDMRRRRTNTTVALDKPGTPPERLAAADAAVGKPETTTDRLAEIKAPEESPEMAEVAALDKSGALTKDEKAVLSEVTALGKRADDYAKAYEAAAMCLARAV